MKILFTILSNNMVKIKIFRTSGGNSSSVLLLFRIVVTPSLSSLALDYLLKPCGYLTPLSNRVHEIFYFTSL